MGTEEGQLAAANVAEADLAVADLAVADLAEADVAGEPIIEGQTAAGRGGWRHLARAPWHEVERDGAPWGVGASVAAALLVVPVVAVVALGIAAFDVPLFTFVTAEDSVLEWPQFATLVVAAVLFVAIARQSRFLGLRWWVAGALLAALAACFVAGEEISWGQRILGLTTPAGLAAINHQDELTLHNIGPIQTLFGYAEMLAGLVGCLLPITVWAWVRSGRRSPLPALLVPPLALVALFALTAGYRLLRLLVVPEPRFRIVKFGELPELSLYLGVAVLAWLIYRRMKCDPRSATLPGEPGG